MKRHLVKRLLTGVVIAALTLPLSACSAQDTLKLSPENAITTNGGVFEGWGTSLCWWANRLGYSDSLSEQAADLFFGPDGLSMNIMRYNIGGGDDPAHTHITRTDSAVAGWLIYDKATGETAFDPAADARQLNVLSRAVKAAGEDALVEVFSNSPPYFMTESGCSSGAFDAGDNNLRPECVGDFADYLARVTAYIRDDLGIPVYSLSPMNEPNTDYWQAMSWKQEGCHVDSGERQSAILTAAADAMARYGLDDVILAASDETSPYLAAAAYKAYTPQARQAVGRINTHTYSDKGGVTLAKLAKAENINLWMSEVDGGETTGKQAGEMGAALWLGQKIISDINKLQPSAWVLWQVVDNHISSEGMNGNRDSGMVDVSGGFWGTAVADHDRQTILLTQKYYGLGQFTRYIRPGSTLITCGRSALAAYHPQEKTLSVVLLNADGREKPLSLDLSAFALAGGAAQAVRTSGSMESGEQWAALDPIPVKNGGVELVLAPYSITTLSIGAAL